MVWVKSYMWRGVMPVIKLNRVWNYCTYDKAFFIFILALFLALSYMDDYFIKLPTLFSTPFLCFEYCFIMGYGLQITRDRANNGVRLPKILIKDVLLLGVQGIIFVAVFFIVQGWVLQLLSVPFSIQNFDLEDLLLNFHDTVNLIYTNDIVYLLEFFVFGGGIFYISTFFMEIALARLADTGNILKAFNIFSLIEDINSMGWLHYAFDCTLIILALVVLSYIEFIVIPNDFLEYIFMGFVELLLFATQFLGIGAVYAEVKDKRRKATKFK